MKVFKEPILSLIFYIVGVVIAVLGVITAGGAFVGYGLLGDAFSGVAAGIVTLVVTVLVALPMFGIAQVIDYFGRTAFHAQSIDEQIMRYCERDMKSPSRRIADPVEEWDRKQSFSQGLKPQRTNPQNTIECPLCGAPIDQSTVKVGSNTCPACGGQFTATA